VTNTPWGERVSFVFNPNADLVAKPLHVSPFMDMLGNWKMHASLPGRNLSLTILVQHPEFGNYFTATLEAKKVEQLIVNPEIFIWLVPHKVAVWIYWQLGTQDKRRYREISRLVPVPVRIQGPLGQYPTVTRIRGGARSRGWKGRRGGGAAELIGFDRKTNKFHKGSNIMKEEIEKALMENGAITLPGQIDSVPKIGPLEVNRPRSRQFSHRGYGVGRNGEEGIANLHPTPRPGSQDPIRNSGRVTHNSFQESRDAIILQNIPNFFIILQFSVRDWVDSCKLTTHDKIPWRITEKALPTQRTTMWRHMEDKGKDGIVKVSNGSSEDGCNNKEDVDEEDDNKDLSKITKEQPKWKEIGYSFRRRTQGIIAFVLLITTFLNALQLWWKGIPFISHPKYANGKAYRDQALKRDSQLQSAE
ncbi:hypothetical protein KI387_031849, partial [Taxus chinensis]